MVLLVLSILLFFSVSTWTIFYVGRESHLTISEHVVKTKQTQLWFGVIGFLAAACGSLGILIELLQRYQASILAYLVYGFIMLGFFIAALIPRTTGRGQRIHDAGAWGSCYLIPIGMLISLTWNMSQPIRTLGIILMCVECVLLILLFTVKRLQNNYLGFQVTYLGIFFIFLLLMAH